MTHAENTITPWHVGQQTTVTNQAVNNRLPTEPGREASNQTRSQNSNHPELHNCCTTSPQSSAASHHHQQTCLCLPRDSADDIQPVPINALTESCTSSTSARHPKALSTSFEKTCMRQIHCPDRLIAMVNKGPYHAQGLFKLKRTQSRTEASLWFCCVRICSCWKLRRHISLCKLLKYGLNLPLFCKIIYKSK